MRISGPIDAEKAADDAEDADAIHLFGFSGDFVVNRMNNMENWGFLVISRSEGGDFDFLIKIILGMLVTWCLLENKTSYL